MPHSSLTTKSLTIGIFSCLTACISIPCAFYLGLPGPDGDAWLASDVIERLHDSLTYQIARTPGQPFLDYCNYISHSIGSTTGLKLWFIAASLCGLAALVSLLIDYGHKSGVALTLCIGLSPHFLAHTGGLGDFAASTGLLLMAIFSIHRKQPQLGALIFALAIGCRLTHCLLAVPLAIYAYLLERQNGGDHKQAMQTAAKLFATAALISLFFYAPIFCYWTPSTLFTSAETYTPAYHISATLFRLFDGLGIFFWICAPILGIVAYRSSSAPQTLPRRGLLVLGATITCVSLLTLLYMPTKTEFTLLTLLGITFSCASGNSKLCSRLLLTSVVLNGVIRILPYDPDTAKAGLFVRPGWYMEYAMRARRNAETLTHVRNWAMAGEGKGILVTRSAWSFVHPERLGIHQTTIPYGEHSIDVFSFDGSAEDRFAIHFQNKRLKAFLESNAAAPSDSRFKVEYEPWIKPICQRFLSTDLSAYGSERLIMEQIDPWLSLPLDGSQRSLN